ncbi:DUF3592 domain-containing protein [Opitutus sp. ER46]|uniref:DUF3592 domain-containing protein n=1 Tax=Opitutus sp. ER46 TaxID=2161864 RepID=UPI0031B8730B
MIRVPAGISRAARTPRPWMAEVTTSIQAWVLARWLARSMEAFTEYRRTPRRQHPSLAISPVAATARPAGFGLVARSVTRPTRRSQMTSGALWTVALMPLPFWAFAWLAFKRGAPAVSVAFRSRRWPQTDAEITSMTVLRARYLNDGPSNRWRWYVRYRYRLGSETYWGDHKTRSARSLEGMQAKFPYGEGGRVPIYYCPENPHESCVVPGFTVERLALWIVGALLAVCPTILCVMLLFASLRS